MNDVDNFWCTSFYWHFCKDELPDFDKQFDFFVIVQEEDSIGKKDWIYHVDKGWKSCSKYGIDGIWETGNDWCEGQEVHIVAWAEIPDISSFFERRITND